MREAIQIAIGAAVEGDEGFFGEVDRIDLDPTGTFATQVAVRPRHEGGQPRLVPAALLEPGPNGPRLHRTLKGFEEFPLANGPGR